MPTRRRRQRALPSTSTRSSAAASIGPLERAGVADRPRKDNRARRRRGGREPRARRTAPGPAARPRSAPRGAGELPSPRRRSSRVRSGMCSTRAEPSVENDLLAARHDELRRAPRTPRGTCPVERQGPLRRRRGAPRDRRDRARDRGATPTESGAGTGRALPEHPPRRVGCRVSRTTQPRRAYDAGRLTRAAGRRGRRRGRGRRRAGRSRAEGVLPRPPHVPVRAIRLGARDVGLGRGPPAWRSSRSAHFLRPRSRVSTIGYEIGVGILTGILTLPLAPVRGTMWVAERVLEEAERQLNTPEAIERQIVEAEEAQGSR